MAYKPYTQYQGKPLHLNSKMPFGVHKGVLLYIVLRENPNYVVYMLKRKQIRLKPSALFRLYEHLDALAPVPTLNTPPND